MCYGDLMSNFLSSDLGLIVVIPFYILVVTTLVVGSVVGLFLSALVLVKGPELLCIGMAKAAGFLIVKPIAILFTLTFRRLRAS